MEKRLQSLPLIIMLVTGAITSIITYVMNYDGKTALLILLGVLLFFYIAGSLFRSMIIRFEKEQQDKERARIDEEGKVLAKQLAEMAEMAENSETENAENS